MVYDKCFTIYVKLNKYLIYQIYDTGYIYGNPFYYLFYKSDIWFNISNVLYYIQDIWYIRYLI